MELMPWSDYNVLLELLHCQLISAHTPPLAFYKIIQWLITARRYPYRCIPTSRSDDATSDRHFDG